MKILYSGTPPTRLSSCSSQILLFVNLKCQNMYISNHTITGVEGECVCVCVDFFSSCNAPSLISSFKASLYIEDQ